MSSILYFTYCMSLGELIRKRRTDAKLTQEEVAGKVGVSRVQFGKYENDEAKPRSDVFMRLQTELNIHPSDLTAEDDSNTAQLVIPFDKVCDLEVQLERKPPDSVKVSIRVKKAS